jgi:hypothetical protein
MAGVGLAFELPIANDRARLVRLKPSVEYRNETMELNVLLGEAQSIDGGEVCPCRSATVEVGEKQSFHAVGPGLELEMEWDQSESTIMTLYGAFRAYHVVDGRSIEAQADASFDDGSPLSIRGRFERDDWSYRFGVGLRVRWNPR